MNKLKPISAFKFALCISLGMTALPYTNMALAQEDTRELEEVVITGSRIKRNDFSSISPMTSLSEEDLSVSGNLTPREFSPGSAVNRRRCGLWIQREQR